MSDKIVIPVITHQHSATEVDAGGAASLGKRVREAASETIKNLPFDAEALDSAINAATSILGRATAAASRLPGIELDTMSIHIGITASGSVGLLGTGAEVEADASFEITFKIKRDH